MGGNAKRGRENDDGDRSRENIPAVAKSQPAPKPVQVQKGSDRFKKFQSMLVRLFSSARTDELSVAQVEEGANTARHFLFFIFCRERVA